LLAKLKQNLVRHRLEYEKQKQGYLEDVRAALTERLASLKNENFVDLNFRGLTAPKSFAREYERAIEMLEWEASEMVALSEDDFRRYVQDDWDWQNIFAANSKKYSVRR
jgi:hypothetical protein